MTLMPASLVLTAAFVITLSPGAAAGGQQPGGPPPPPPPTAARPTPVPPPTPAPVTTPAPPRPPRPRGVVSASALFQPGTHSFADARTFTYLREPATRTADYAIDGAAGFDLGVFARLWRNLGAGVSLTQVSRPGEAAVTAKYPHPFFFNQPRTATAVAADLDRAETAVHVSAAYLVPATGRFGVALFAGPTFFNLTQDLIDDVTVTETYPYDTVAIATGAPSERSESAVGFHAGADLTWYFTRRVGAGALVRYAAGKKSVTGDGGTAFDLEAGGLQIGVGLRVKF